jgi:hypothetical protein
MLDVSSSKALRCIEKGFKKGSSASRISVEAATWPAPRHGAETKYYYSRGL